MKSKNIFEMATDGSTKAFLCVKVKPTSHKRPSYKQSALNFATEIAPMRPGMTYRIFDES